MWACGKDETLRGDRTAAERKGKRERKKKEEKKQEKRKSSVNPSPNLLDSKGMGHETPLLFSLRLKTEKKKTLGKLT